MPRAPLLNWQDWQLPFERPPVILRELDGGRINSHYLLEADGRKYVLRQASGDSGYLGIHREQEARILEHVVKAGLAPRTLFHSIEDGVLINEYLEGEHWKPALMKDDIKLELLVDSLKAVHRINMSLPDYDYRRQAEGYWLSLVNRGFRAGADLRQRHDTCLQITDLTRSSRCLCHHDPNPLNIIASGETLYFLDWEYAGWGWPAFDFAALAEEWKLEPARVSALSGVPLEDLENARFLYTHLCELWSLLHGSQGS